MGGREFEASLGSSFSFVSWVYRQHRDSCGHCPFARLLAAGNPGDLHWATRWLPHPSTELAASPAQGLPRAQAQFLTLGKGPGRPLTRQPGSHCRTVTLGPGNAAGMVNLGVQRGAC